MIRYQFIPFPMVYLMLTAPFAPFAVTPAFPLHSFSPFVCVDGQFHGMEASFSTE